MKKRKRGAQPGNLNAMKHGFYSPFLSPEEISLIWNTVNLKGADPAVAVIRVKLHAALQRFPANHRLLEDAAKLLTKKRLAEQPMDAFNTSQYRAWVLGALENVHDYSSAPAKQNETGQAQNTLQDKTRLSTLKPRRSTNRACQAQMAKQHQSSVI